MKSISLRRVALAVAGLTALAGVALAQGPVADLQPDSAPPTVSDLTLRAQEHAVAMDLDQDGYITAAETRAFREQRREARAAEKFARLDANKDGKVSLAEFSAEHTARIQAMDSNGDGVVERSEMRAGHRRGGHGGHHGARCGEAAAG